MLGPALAAGIVAASLFWIAYDNGSYGVESRDSLAIAIWWTVVALIVFGLVPKERFLGLRSCSEPCWRHSLSGHRHRCSGP